MTFFFFFFFFSLSFLLGLCDTLPTYVFSFLFSGFISFFFFFIYLLFIFIYFSCFCLTDRSTDPFAFNRWQPSDSFVRRPFVVDGKFYFYFFFVWLVADLFVFLLQTVPWDMMMRRRSQLEKKCWWKAVEDHDNEQLGGIFFYFILFFIFTFSFVIYS